MKKAIDILYADAHILVVHKASGLLSVPGRSTEKPDSVVSLIRDAYPHCIHYPAVHRLDMDTSGLMILALTKEALRLLSKQMEAREIQKEYIAILDGKVHNSSGLIRLRFRLDVQNRPRQIYDEIYGKEGITEWQKLSEDASHSCLLFKPLTGRTHQLRVHAAHPKGLGIPILGDRLYGCAKEGQRLHLHASRLVFTHPYTQRTLDISSKADFL